MGTSDDKWYLTKEQLANTPSRRAGIDVDKELSYRQQAANFIQDLGQRLRVTQLCINTAIVYMHRFYLHHSLSQFHRNSIAAAAIFLAAKVEEQPRKLELVINVAHMCLYKEQAPETKSEQYLEQARDLVFNENVLLQTLGFEVAIDHPHTHVVRCCQLVKASKELAQTSYFMASNSLHLTTMCLQYKPTVVACFCIHLACKWSNWEIPQSNEGKHWFWYVDKTVTLELLQRLTSDFLQIFEKCPSRLKRKIMSISANQSPNMNHPPSLSNSPFESEPRKIQSTGNAESSFFNRFHQEDKRATISSSTSSSKPPYDFQNKDHNKSFPNPHDSRHHIHPKAMVPNKNIPASASTSSAAKNNSFRHHHHHQKMDPKLANPVQKQLPPNNPPPSMPRDPKQRTSNPYPYHQQFHKDSNSIPNNATQIKKPPAEKPKKNDFLEQRRSEDIRKLIEKPLTIPNIKPEIKTEFDVSLLNRSLPIIELGTTELKKECNLSMPSIEDLEPKIKIEKPSPQKQRSLFSPEKTVNESNDQKFCMPSLASIEQHYPALPMTSFVKTEIRKEEKPSINYASIQESLTVPVTLPSQIFEKKQIPNVQTISALLHEPLPPMPSLIPSNPPPVEIKPQELPPKKISQEPPQPVPQAVPEKEKSSKAEKKKKKEKKHKHGDKEKSRDKERHKHKHKDKDRSKSRSSQHSQKNTQEKQPSADFSTPIKITIPRDKLVDVPDSAGLKIKIPRERLKGSEGIGNSATVSSSSKQAQAASNPLKIKIRTDLISQPEGRKRTSEAMDNTSRIVEPPLKRFQQDDAINFSKK